MAKPRRMRWSRHVARKRQKRNAYRVFVGKPEGKVPLRKARPRWENNIKTDIK
jgi:hypothetical protein